jgi:hypothetical protein
MKATRPTLPLRNNILQNDSSGQRAIGDEKWRDYSAVFNPDSSSSSCSSSKSIQKN